MKKDISVGLIIFVLSVLFALDLKDVKNPGIMDNQVGVAIFPWIMVVALGLLGLFVAIAGFLKLRKAAGKPVQRPVVGFWTKYTVPYVMLLMVTIYIVLVPVIGFYVMSFVFFIALGVLLGGFDWKNILRVSIGAVATVAAVYGIFQISLQLWMPQGLLF
jgi:hypothetical protein